MSYSTGVSANANKELLDRLAQEFQSPESNQFKVISVLVDQKWHCRHHEYTNAGVSTAQLAGGGGIQGLQRGTKKRSGFEIESKNQFCGTCGHPTRWDRWTGNRKAACAGVGLTRSLVERILQYYEYTDAIEQRKRREHELIIDHKFPMIRWGDYSPPKTPTMPEEVIERVFQLLKKDSAGNHNLLKSRACEHCVNSGQRGTPFGIKFLYEGSPRWPEGVPHSGSAAEMGCHGCGWYNFKKWRESLNRRLQAPSS